MMKTLRLAAALVVSTTLLSHVIKDVQRRDAEEYHNLLHAMHEDEQDARD